MLVPGERLAFYFDCVMYTYTYKRNKKQKKRKTSSMSIRFFLFSFISDYESPLEWIFQSLPYLYTETFICKTFILTLGHFYSHESLKKIEHHANDFHKIFMTKETTMRCS